jgi:phage terminase large subunit-like protein
MTKPTRSKRSIPDPSRPPKASEPIDRAHAYALDVVAGKVIAGPNVRASCKRFLDDLAHGEKRGLWYDADAAARVMAFFETILVLTGGKFDQSPFLLHPSQCFIVGNLFGWKKQDGRRRFRRCYMEIAKGAGKTPLLAGIGLYGLLADGEAASEVYVAAAKKEQAMIMFKDARNMVHLSPALSRACKVTGGDHQPNIAHLKSMSRMTVMSSEKSKSGFRPHFALCDEVHEHPSPDTINMLERGFKGRDNPLLCMITNSGFDKKSICWEEHHHAVKVAHGDLPDDSTFSFVCSLDDGDDPLKDPSCWIKANPLLGVTISHEQMRTIVEQAKAMPGKRNNIMRLHFCQWTDADAAWMARETWEKCETTLHHAEYNGQSCYAGLDLSRTTDLTAFAMLYPQEDGTLDVFVEFWLPKDNLKQAEDRDRAPYPEWYRQGYIHATPGKTIGYDWVFARIAQINAETPIRMMGYDRYKKEEMDAEIIRQGHDNFPAKEVGQGVISMNPAINRLEELIITERIRFHYNPILRWNVQSVVTESDAAGNRKFTKAKSTGRIDGIQAVANAISVWMKDINPKKPSVYETRGIITFDF